MNDTFSSNPRTEWLTEPEADRQMRLLEDFSYTDPDGGIWLAAAGSVINGASIPAPLWSTVGSPYTGEYRRASIVHDVACEKAASSSERKAADGMFYYACLAGGCTRAQARLLYIGVRIGAWAGRVPLWSRSAALSPAVTKKGITFDVTDISMQATFHEIAADVEQMGEDVSFKDIENVVDHHLAAKAQQASGAPFRE